MEFIKKWEQEFWSILVLFPPIIFLILPLYLKMPLLKFISLVFFELSLLLSFATIYYLILSH